MDDGDSLDEITYFRSITMICEIVTYNRDFNEGIVILRFERKLHQQCMTYNHEPEYSEGPVRWRTSCLVSVPNTLFPFNAHFVFILCLCKYLFSLF